MRLRQLIKDIVNDVDIYPNIKINDISTNSCAIKKGSLFFAIEGSNHDGHDYINDAIKNKVSAIIASKTLKNLPWENFVCKCMPLSTFFFEEETQVNTNFCFLKKFFLNTSLKCPLLSL